MSAPIRPYADNVVLELEPLPTQTKSGLAIVDTSRKTKGHRTARVIASGPGYWGIPTYSSPGGVFIANETRAGDRVVVDSLAGQDWSMNMSAPRHHERAQEFEELLGRRGEIRVVREAEILAIIEEES